MGAAASTKWPRANISCGVSCRRAGAAMLATQLGSHALGRREGAVGTRSNSLCGFA